MTPAEQVLDRLYGLLGEVVLLPIPLHGKAPRITNWNKIALADTNKYRQDLLSAAARGGNIGVLLGPASNRLLALDLDNDGLINQWLTRHPWLVDTLRSKGKRGCQFWLRLEADCQYPNGKAIHPLNENGKIIGELRLGGAGGAQSIIWGVHPEGMRYQIVVNKAPLLISLADLDELAPGLVWQESPGAHPASNPSATFDIWDRVIAYLDKCDPAVAGERGHDKTYGVLCQVICGFDLSPQQALDAANYYNQKCEPPWNEKELKHKVEDALKATANDSRGHLLQSKNEPPLSRRLEEDKAQREAAKSNGAYHQESHPAGTVDLEKETQERLKQYTSEQVSFPPPMRSEAFHGILGEVVKIMTKHCESSPEVLLLHGLVIVGNIMGRSAYVYGGGPKLFPNEFAVFVGETARGRKGTAYAMWEQLAELVNADWFSGCFSNQVQSGEGIVSRIRDERYGVPPGKKKKGEPLEEVLLDAGVSDKRLLILEEELSHVLKMAQRSGNTLSEVLRRAWDSPSVLRNDNKNSPQKATDPHVSFIGHITRDELLKVLNIIDLNNGMANRMLWCAARRTGDMPNAEFLNWKNHQTITEKLNEIFQQRYANTSKPALFSRSSDARNYWDQLYRKLNAQKLEGTMDAILARDTSHILKIALIFAVADSAQNIERQHLQAALAVIDFCRDSARWTFGQVTGNRLANLIYWELSRSPAGLTRSDITRDVCRGNTTKTQLDLALSTLVKNKLAKVTMEKGEKGHGIERWFAVR